MSALEALAAALIVVNVWLVGRRSFWNYAFGIAGVCIYALIFFRARLYSDTLLQAFFLVLNIYGWFNWSRAKAVLGEVTVLRLERYARAQWLAGIATLTITWGWLMDRYTDAAAPWLDAAVAMTSVAAQILLARRFIENWWLWIAVNMMSIALYASRGLWLTMGLYCGLLAVSLWSLRAWQKAAR